LKPVSTLQSSIYGTFSDLVATVSRLVTSVVSLNNWRTFLGNQQLIH